MGARLSGSRTLAELPKYGGVGSFGLQGLGTQAHDLQMIGSGLEYGFAPGRVYNLEASRVICNGDGASGAHSDIAHPEVAHAAWQRIAAGVRAQSGVIRQKPSPVVLSLLPLIFLAPLGDPA